MNESMLRSLNLEANSLIGEQTQRITAAKHLLHEAIMIIREQQATINILNQVIDSKDECISTLDATIEVLKSIAKREQQLRNIEGI